MTLAAPPPAVYRHVLCVYPYRRTGSSLTAFPPLGLEYIAAALRPYAQRIELINFRHERTPSTLPFLKADTDLVCYSINWRRELDRIRDDINSLPAGVKIILGGRVATQDPGYWLEACPNVAAVVCGDGEQAIAEIAQGRPYSQVDGLCHRGANGQVIHTPPRANAPLDENLLPARHLRRRPYYLTIKGVSTGIKMDMVAGSRGCPYNCKFCNFSVNPWGVKRRWAPRSPRSIVDEIAQSDADVIFFVDDVFTHLPDRVAEICDLLIARKIRKHYIVNARLEIAKRPDVIRKMEQVGFTVLMVGVESTQDKTLASMGKGFTVAQVRERFEVLRRSKMLVNAYFIVGNIGESEQQMLSTAPFARSIGAGLIHVSRLRNEPHSGLAELVAQTPGYHIDPRGFVYSDRYSSAHIAGLRKQIDRQFHTVPHVIDVMFKLLKRGTLRVALKALLRLPVYFALLLVTQTARKIRKWMGDEKAPKPQDKP